MIDCHLHLQDEAFQGHEEELIAQLRSLGVELLAVNGTSESDWGRVAILAERFSEVVPFFGVHPWKISEASPKWSETLKELLARFPAAGLGEIGLDKWIRNHDIAQQREMFLAQLELAQQYSRPVTVHCLQAWGHLQECLKMSSFSRSFLLHSFGGPRELISEFLEQGAYFSLSGYLLRSDKVEKLKAFEEIPKDRILLETDAPDMAPPIEYRSYSWERAPGAKKDPNHPGNIEAIYSAYAEWSGQALESLVQQQRENFSAFVEGKAQKD